MEEKRRKLEENELYEKPRVLASYNKEELEEAIQPHEGQVVYGGCGCGCGCGA
jgi:hypothetical protein